MYGIKDLFTTSYAEGERNKYKKAVKKLDQEIPLITEYIGYVREYADDIHNAYTENGGSNAGQYVTRFDEKENDNHSKVTTIIQNMEWALTGLQDKRTYAVHSIHIGRKYVSRKMPWRMSTNHHRMRFGQFPAAYRMKSGRPKPVREERDDGFI